MGRMDRTWRQNETTVEPKCNEICWKVTLEMDPSILIKFGLFWAAFLVPSKFLLAAFLYRFLGAIFGCHLLSARAFRRTLCCSSLFQWGQDEVKIRPNFYWIFNGFLKPKWSQHGHHMEPKWTTVEPKWSSQSVGNWRSKWTPPFWLNLGFLGSVGSIQIVLDSSFTIVGFPYSESCELLLAAFYYRFLRAIFGCHILSARAFRRTRCCSVKRATSALPVPWHKKVFFEP